MDQAALIDRIAEVLEPLPGLGSAFLGGSHGRDEADAYSDVDVYVVVAEADDIPDLLSRLEQSVDEIGPILFKKTLPNARTINCITTDWLRFDLTVVSGIELAFVAGGAAKPLFDRLGLAEALPTTPAGPPAPSADAILDVVNEFIRVLGLSMVVKGRNDLGRRADRGESAARHADPDDGHGERAAASPGRSRPTARPDAGPTSRAAGATAARRDMAVHPRANEGDRRAVLSAGAYAGRGT